MVSCDKFSHHLEYVQYHLMVSICFHPFHSFSILVSMVWGFEAFGPWPIFSDSKHRRGFLHRLDVPSSGLVAARRLETALPMPRFIWNPRQKPQELVALYVFEYPRERVDQPVHCAIVLLLRSSGHLDVVTFQDFASQYVAND